MEHVQDVGVQVLSKEQGLQSRAVLLHLLMVLKHQFSSNRESKEEEEESWAEAWFFMSTCTYIVHTISKYVSFSYEEKNKRGENLQTLKDHESEIFRF